MARAHPSDRDAGAAEAVRPYVHLPFCESKCSYCDFYSVAHDGRREPRYLEAVRLEIARRAPAHFAPPTVFVGGGTPTALDDADFDVMLAMVAAAARPDASVEWTIECNPGSLTPRKARAMRDAGVTRVSIWVQSFDDRILRSVGRVHDARQAREAVTIARGAGIPQVSVDLLFAIPGQGMDTFARDLEEAVALGTDHVSAYALLYEDGTTLTRKLDEGRVAAEEEDVELAMLRLARDRLGAAGFGRYEVSNFARPGCECRHNVNYWRNGEYLGVGASAASYLNGERRSNVASWTEYQESIHAGGDPMASSERLAPIRAMGEEVMVRLRLAEGMSLREIGDRWGLDARGAYRALVARYERAGLFRVTGDGDRVAFTDRGMEVADGVIAEFVATP
ncbi:MAG: radical SAM family heme chaperone HemW [Planctomycetes bacterium]|nr:radical SAM family heme chaperone HemW [Planctomycetota bacterium]